VIAAPIWLKVLTLFMGLTVVIQPPSTTFLAG